MTSTEGYIRSPEDEALMAHVREESKQDDLERHKRMEEVDALTKEKEELETRIQEIDTRLNELEMQW